MKRWLNIAAVGGFLIVLAFVAERFFLVRAPLAGLSWADLRDLWRDLWRDFGRDLVLFILMNAAILLAILTILWGGYLWFRPKPPKDEFAVPQSSIARRMFHVVEVAVLSVLMALAATGLSKMRTPGWWVAGTLNKPGPDLNLGVFIGSAIVVDSGICFAILWGGYLLWKRAMT